MAEVGAEAAGADEAVDERRRLVRGDLPGAAAALARQVGVLGRGQDVELLAAVRAVAVVEVAELFEDVEGPVHGRGGGLRVALATPLDDLAPGHVAGRGAEDLEDQAALRGPAEPARAELLPDVGPGPRGGVGGLGGDRLRDLEALFGIMTGPDHRARHLNPIG